MNNNNFIEASKRERFAFNQFIDIYQLFKEKDNYSLFLTPDDSYDVYDALVQKFDDNTYNCCKRYIIEFKIRNVNHNTLIDCRENGWILESKKYNSLLEIAKLDPDKNDIIYISFNNDNTIVWNLSNLKRKGLLKKTTKVMNKATMNSRTDKVNKSIYLLKEEWGKMYKYTYDEQSYIANINKEKNLQSIRNDDVKATYCIFDELTKKTNK